jgi:hypothetical protein
MFLSFFVVFPFFQIAEHPKFVPFAPSTDFSDRPAPTPPAGTPSLLGGALFPAEALQTPQGKLQHTTALRMPLGRMHLVAGLCVLKSLLHMVYILPCTEKSVVFRSLKEIPSACSHMICGKNCHMMSYAASNLKLVTPKMTLQPHNATNPNNTRDRVPFMFLFMFKDILLFSV